MGKSSDLTNTTPPTIFIDGHADTAQRFVDEGWDFSGDLDGGMLSLNSAREGGLSAEFFAIWVEPVQWKGRYAERTFALIQGVLDQATTHPDTLKLCVSPADVFEAHRSGRFAMLMGIEGGHSIENSLDLLRSFYHLGVRYMTLTWSNTNEWADSSGDEEDSSVRHHGGLTSFGRDVIAEMNRLGMMIDVSHASDATLSDVLEASRVPIIASHSSARALTNSHRNLSDDQIKQIASKGGMVMVNFFPAFIDEEWKLAWLSLKEERQTAHDDLSQRYSLRGKPIPYKESNQIDKDCASRIPRAPLASLIDHIDHVAEVAGIDHIGIGTDFDGIPSLPEGIDSAADLPKITSELSARGYSDEDLRKLLGGNLLRVMGEVQAVVNE